MYSMSSGKYLKGLSGRVVFVFIFSSSFAVVGSETHVPSGSTKPREKRGWRNQGCGTSLHWLPRTMRGEVVFPALFRPLVTQPGERVDRLVNHTWVGASILEHVE